MTKVPEPPPQFDYIETIREMVLHTDTTTAVVLASRVEDWLGSAIQTRMRDNLSARLRERLFEGYGPLSTFSGKIDIGYALSMFEADVYNDLRAIKDIRNRFAHSKNVVHFKSDELKSDLQKLTGWTKETEPETLFMSRCTVCIDCMREHIKQSAMVTALKEHAASQRKSRELYPPHRTAPDESEAKE